MKDKKIKFFYLIVSIFFSIFCVIGKSIMDTGTIDILFLSVNKTIVTITIILLLTVVFYLLIYFTFKFMDNYKPKKTKKSNKIYELIFIKHPIIAPFLIILLCGLPYIIFFYPGSVQWDGMKQLNFFYGIQTWTNHHPVLPTVIMGMCIKLGRIILNDNFGVFIFTFTQFLISTVVFTYVINFMKKLGAPKALNVITLIFFALVTMWPMNAYTLVKDTYFYLIFILFFIELIKLFLAKDKNLSFKNYIPLLIISVLLILFRNNGIHIVLLSFLFLIFIKKDSKEILYKIILISIIIILNVLYNSFLLPKLNINPSAIRETLSVPIQQIARYLKEGKELTLDEQSKLEELFPVGLEYIKENYNPEISDPIKFKFKGNVSTEDMKNLFKVWTQLLKKHPKVYVDAFLENYYGYFYPPKHEFKDGLGWYNIVTSSRVNTGYFNFHMNDKFINQRKAIENIAYQIREIPIIGLIYSCGFYAWLLIIGIGYLLQNRKWKALIPVIPLLGIYLFCFLSPVNAYIRYIQPIMVVMPIFIAYIFYNKKTQV